MKTLLIFFVSISLISCTNQIYTKSIPSKSDRESIAKDLVGIWELMKQSYRPTEVPSLVSATSKEYLEIKSDGTCSDGNKIYNAKWFLTYSDAFIFDSTSKVIFTEAYGLNHNGWDEYNRSIKPFQIKISTENGIKYLYLTSLVTSATRVYIRKN